MKKRRRALPPGWYPESRDEITRVFSSWESDLPTATANGIAGIVPHAGWTFSGRLAYRVFRELGREVETVIVVGGHLPGAAGVYAAIDDLFETPLGEVPGDMELLECLSAKLSLKEDNHPDNTVEIQLPMVKYFFPESQLLWLRSSPEGEGKGLGLLLHECALSLERKIIVIGSTDLTHYGPNYGFMPRGTGKEARNWVKEENDRQVINAFLTMDREAAIESGVKKMAACSAGGALSAMEFAGASGCGRGELLEYGTSYDIHPSDSFVGYGAIIYRA